MGAADTPHTSSCGGVMRGGLAQVKHWTGGQSQLSAWEGQRRTELICSPGGGCEGVCILCLFSGRHIPTTKQFWTCCTGMFGCPLTLPISISFPQSLRRDALRFLKAIDPDRFADGVRQTLSDDEIAMAFWLSTGFPPQLRLRDLRASDRGDLNLHHDWQGFVSIGSHYVGLCQALCRPWNHAQVSHQGKQSLWQLLRGCLQGMVANPGWRRSPRTIQTLSLGNKHSGPSIMKCGAHKQIKLWVCRTLVSVPHGSTSYVNKC